MWQQPRGEIQYYIIDITNLNTSESVTHFLGNYTNGTHIDSLHPYHHFNFSIAAKFELAMGPLRSDHETIQMPEAGNPIAKL
jgi:hypothetical protein